MQPELLQATNGAKNVMQGKIISTSTTSLNTGFAVIVPLSSQLVKGLLCSFTFVEITIWVLLSGST